MSSSQRNVYVHQSNSGSSTAGSSSRSSSSSAYYESSNSRSGSTRREYEAAGRTAEVVRSGHNLVINHNRTDYERGSPSPRYRSGYQ
ncbi:uncharacterized protein TRIVIDRAFT_225086 [Trichoderma virens Gv29-8]|uniref:Uncharacterized protein n=1 Tax=Hypocrea virens (strain Gv29-8 / FGSC 10586) TaxID=413071 RepID=G9N2A3_HYPVG|nr:uncharacterized protein TRIVIDRAFT_225086 [Trichoderma virens Gv29-8]EHK19217.1 hypothetical protein TRIVIDRAFT_225086 [Trichoderma virens Gv29-8]UKZ49331.1 hypothetical protein TrVGV298_003577 [Trichoderma virens]UKZ75859.1 hypothetical protein TrVFT333_003554 [Trichoderma virens FT-333]